MSRETKRRTLDLTRLTAIVASTAVVLFIALRSLYAFSLFGDFTSNLRENGWKDPGAGLIMQPKETVTFEASYLFLKLGRVRFELLGRADCHGIPSYRIRAFIDSYSGIPFVNYHAVYETCADARTLMCISTSNDREDGDKWIHTDYVFDYAARQLRWKQSEGGVLLKQVVRPLDTTYTDGLSFFYFVRRACFEAGGRKDTLTIPIVSDSVRSSVTLTINEKREGCKVPAVAYPVEASRMSGHINFKGTFGVTGDFSGWISDDSVEMPLRADLRVILGSIVVKLDSVSRDNWTPPRAAK